MKRLMCLVLTVMMVVSTVTPAFAFTIKEKTHMVPNPLELQLEVGVGARATSVGGTYLSALAVQKPAAQSVGVDYHATLDMAPVRSFLASGGFIDSVIMGDTEASAEFAAAKVTSEIVVTIAYDNAAIITSDLRSSNVGSLDAGSIFKEVSRTLSGNKLTITYDNSKTGDLTAGDLRTNKNEYLKDIAFTLDNQVEYANEGRYSVSVTLSGTTTIAFSEGQPAEKIQQVKYIGGASNIVTITDEIVVDMCVLEVVPAKPATCTEDGYKEYVRCATHGESCTKNPVGIIPEVNIPMLEHMLGGVSMKVQIPYVAPTCASIGMKEHWTCALCKCDFVSRDSDVIVPHEDFIIPVSSTHTGEQPLVAIPATCTEDGKTAGKKCMDCGRITLAQTVIPKTGHQNKVPVGTAVAATCTATGKTAGEKCNDCGRVLTPQETIPKTGHNFGPWQEVTPATELAEGLKERTCQNNCGTTETEIIPKLEHIHTISDKMAVITVQPTCTTGGKKQNYCACGVPMGAEEDIPADGHYLDEIQAVVSTCVTEGKLRHYKCVICQATFKDAEGTKVLNNPAIPVDKRNHGEGNIIEIPAIKATCQRLGVRAGNKCRMCDTVTVAPKVDRESGYADHKISIMDEQPARCGVTGIEEHPHCAVCNKDFKLENGKYIEIDHEDITIPALEHIFETEIIREATAQQDGDARRYCTQPGCDYEKHFVIPYNKPNHKEVIDDITVHETCTTPGKKNRIYSCCGEIKERDVIIPPHPHTPVLVPSVPSTCHSEGTEAYWKCAECGGLFSSSDMTEAITAPKTTAMLEHEWYVHQDNPAQIIKKCYHCNEVIHIKKDNKARVSNHGGIKEEKNIIQEEAAEEGVVQDSTMVSEINLTERTDISPELEASIPADAAEEKVVFDIEVQRITTYYEDRTGVRTEIDKDIEPVDQTEDIITFEIDIPVGIQGKPRYEVWRRHTDLVTGNTVNEKLTTQENINGEYIEIDVVRHVVTVHAKRFSEYAIISFDTEAPQAPTGGGSGSSKVTVKFNANGGTIVEDVTVWVGKKITAPVTTRAGYTFDGWYTNTNFTTKFDFTQPVRSNMTLYAKWIEGTGTGVGGEGDKIILILGDNTINVFGTDVEHDVPPVAVDNRTMLPIRIIAENLGATVDWNADNQTATITGNGVEIKIALGDKMAYVNGEPLSLDVAAFAQNDRIYLPVRFVSEFLGAKVEWFGKEQKVVITRYGRNEMILTIGERPAYVFGTIIVNDVAPVALNNRTMLPIRFVVENLSGTVDWNAETRTVTINKDGINIKITIDDNIAYVNGEAVELDVAAFAENNRTYLPLRFVAENLNANVEWVPATKSVVITKKY